MSQFDIEFLDSGREPKCPPNPAYPKGIDVDLAHGAEAQCLADIPYPSPRCGLWLVACKTCGIRVAITTAGRPDDPRSAKIACKRPETVQ